MPYFGRGGLNLLEKLDAMLVVFDKELLDSAIQKLNFDCVNLSAIFVDDSTEKIFKIDETEIPLHAFKELPTYAKRNKTFVWLVGDCDAETFRKTKKFLMTFGVQADNVIDIEQKISPTWLANFNYLIEHGADFFATGDEYMRDGLNLDYIPKRANPTEPKYQIDLSGGDFKFARSAPADGVNLAHANQTLRQSYEIAKNIFAKVAPGTVKFVLIGLQPRSFCCGDFEESLSFQNLSALVSEEANTDFNFSIEKKNVSGDFSAKAIVDWQDEQKPLSDKIVAKNTQLSKDYIALCLANNAKPVGVVFPVAPALRQNFDQIILSTFREVIHKLEKNGDFICVDMFDLRVDYNCFFDMNHLNATGMNYVNAFLSHKLYKHSLIPLENFCAMSYEFIDILSTLLSKDDYNDFVNKVFNVSAKRLSRKDKIKIGFVIRNSAEWFGDELYNLFMQDERFELTVITSIEVNRAKDIFLKKEFWDGVEKFKKHGINVVTCDRRRSPVPMQDVFIFSTPYFHMLPSALYPVNIKLTTLITHVTYAFSGLILTANHYNRTMFNIAWKVFLSSRVELDVISKSNRFDFPRGIYSGYPRLDVFFEKNSEFRFNWKMAQPNAKKIIYAPHCSIGDVGSVRISTFRWNYQFMYEFAKAHPEISWVIKPHPTLCSRAVKYKVFPTYEAFDEYMQKWNDLPNAQVYTGAYYQAVFATSDGMIHDCGSFLAEYQFVDKPMIYLTRDGVFNELATAILKASYTVDGKDLDGIAAMMQKVFIDGDDYKAAERKAVFDKYLNYPKYNGMLASEFIYTSIADDLAKD